MSYSAYLLSTESRTELLHYFPAKFSKVIAHHCTYAFPDDVIAPMIEHAYVIGYACSDILECLVVALDGEYLRQSGGIYHITWSLDPMQGAKPKHSNDVLAQGWEKIEVMMSLSKIPIQLTPVLLD